MNITRRASFYLRHNKSAILLFFIGSFCTLIYISGLVGTPNQQLSPGNQANSAEIFKYESNVPGPGNDFMTRHELVKERCTSWRKGHADALKFPMSPVISTKHKPNIFYCPLAKAGSTFFTRYMLALDKPGPMRSPFDINIQDASRSNLEDYDSLGSGQDKMMFLQQAYKFVFSRNPYSRIFSAYVDKLYSPNPYYWQEWGSRAVRKHHLIPWEHKCGTNVSFPDFLKLVVSDLYRSDLHFIPMVHMCQVCAVNWDLVGWVEQSASDIEYLSAKLNVNASFLHQGNYRVDAAMDAIRDSTTDSLNTWIKQISKCQSLYDTGRIIWRKLQIRGFIYSDLPFPFSESDMNSMTAERFQQECQKAAARSTDKSRLKRQKEAAFREAFSQVDPKYLAAIQKIYEDDFFIFGYDPQPSSIYGSEKIAQGQIFHWKVDWVLGTA